MLVANHSVDTRSELAGSDVRRKHKHKHKDKDKHKKKYVWAGTTQAQVQA